MLRVQSLPTENALRAGAEPRRPRLASLSVVLPARNEEGNVELAVLEVWQAAAAVADHVEVIVVDDGSQDRTAAIVEALRSGVAGLRLVRHATSRGYGAALRSGFAAATGEWLFFTDADRQFDVSELARLVALSENHDVVAGIRARRRDPAHRRAMALAWNRFVSLTLRVRLRDINCAFKLLRAEVVRALELTANGAAFGAELALALERHGARIAQLPVFHRPRSWGRPTGGNPRVIADAFREYAGLLARARRPRPGRRTATLRPIAAHPQATISRAR